MARPPVTPPTPKSLKKFFKDRFTFYMLWYYMTWLFIVAFSGLVVLAVWPPFNVYEFVTNGLILLLLLELLIYRYQQWKPEKSKAFAIGATMVVNLVHDEGILSYQRDGQQYALYSNKVGPVDKKKGKKPQ